MSTPMTKKEIAPCDEDIFKHGVGICTFHAGSVLTETWVRKVRQAVEPSGERVDWHYSGGMANVLYLGDYAKVRAAVEALLPELAAACLEQAKKDGTFQMHAEDWDGLVAFRWFPQGSRGLYRAGDTLPEGALAVVTTTDPQTVIVAGKRS